MGIQSHRSVWIFTTALLLSLLAPTVLRAQVRLLVLRGNLLEPVGDLLDFGVVPAGDVKKLDLRIRNDGNLPLTLNTLKLTGDGAYRVFHFDGEPALPRIIGPGLNVGFSIRFEPPTPGQWQVTLEVESVKTLLRGAAGPSLNLYVEGEPAPLISGTSVPFGAVKAGKSATRRFTLRNEAQVALPTGLFLVTGESFRLSSPGPPAQLQAGERAVFDVTFAPRKPGLHSGAIEFSNRRVELEGFATEPDMPRPTILLERSTAASAEQVKVTVTLDAPAEWDGAGLLELVFEPAISGIPPDPSIVFVDSAKTSLPFTVARGERNVRFPSGTQALLQTGTTAGKIRLTASLGANRETALLEIAKSPPKLASARTTTQTGQLTVDVTGFDNTRSITRVSFQFRNREGTLLGAALRADVTEVFRKYFETSQTGGNFLMKAWFPVQGDVAQVGTVEIEMENSAGITQTQRISF